MLPLQGSKRTGISKPQDGARRLTPARSALGFFVAAPSGNAVKDLLAGKPGLS
jgi:hypothetical protein